MTNVEKIDAARKHVEAVPMVQALLEQARKSKLAPLLAEYEDAFMTAPAAATMHHNFTHGLVLHTAEVWYCALPILHGMLACKSVAYDARRLRDAVPASGNAFEFTEDELFVAALLHDFAKIKQYEPAGNAAWKKARMICNQEAWTLRELAKHGIALTDNELVALLHAEGGYTEFEVDWRPISVAMHAADLWSSQAMAAQWDLASEMHVMCPDCGAPMASRNGPRGAFFGCTRYPACRGIKDASSLPDAMALFLTFLKRNYPVSISDAVAAGDIDPADLPF